MKPKPTQPIDTPPQEPDPAEEVINEVEEAPEPPRTPLEWVQEMVSDILRNITRSLNVQDRNTNSQ